ncbi:unnamed protein product [Choristocarpus tenellus]
MHYSYLQDTNLMWLEALRKHSWRTMEPEDAEVFVLLFDVDESKMAGMCRGESHHDRTENAVQTVISSPWYQRNNGRDHFWPLGHWHILYKEHKYYPQSLRNVIVNMTVGRYSTWQQSTQDVSYWMGDGKLEVERGRPWWRNKDEWRCTVLVSVRAREDTYKHDLSYEEWHARGISVYFRGKEGSCTDSAGAATSRAKVFDLNVLPNTSIHKNHAATHEEYVREIQDAQFCLVMECDDPQTSRYTDALAAGCMPLVVDSGFRLSAAPFNRWINFDKIMITVPSNMWNQDPTGAVHYIYTLPESRMRPLYNNMIKARKYLLWEHPHSMVATQGLAEVKVDCLSPGAPSNFPL